MEKYGKAGPQGRKIFPFRTKKAPNGFREPFRKAEKRRRMRDGVPSISFQKAAAVGVFFQNGSAHRHGIWRIPFKTAASRR